jgi:hypothetical protein
MKIHRLPKMSATEILLQLFLPLLFCSVAATHSPAQTSPSYTDWVRNGQTYMEIKVARDGVYRIPAGIVGQYFSNLSSLNPAGFQIFRRGKEVAIRVSAGADQILNGSDFIDFVGFMNDASSELDMYQRPLGAINPYRAIYSDTACYYLTWTSSLDGKRVADNGLVNNASVPFETYGWRKAFRFAYGNYNIGQGLRGNITFSSYFTPGEGWAGDGVSPGYNDNLVIGSGSYAGINGINNLYTSGPDASLEILQYGRTNVTHECEVRISTNLTKLDTFTFIGTSSFLLKKNISLSMIQGSSLHLWVQPKNVWANICNGYAMVRYPAEFQMPNGFLNQRIELNPNPGNYSRIRLQNISALPELYDITNPELPVRIGVGFIGGTYLAGIENTLVARELLIQNQAITVSPSQVSGVGFQNFNPLQFDYIIISHPALRKPALGYADPVQAYADFRATAEGGSHRVLLMEMEEVYRRFGYGDRNPLAIRNLGGFFIQKNVKPKAMFLIGKGLTVRNRFASYYQSENLVPPFGVPPSDNAFALGLGEPGRTMAFPVGRLAARSPAQVAVYLNKVKENEAFAFNDLWKKNIFHISGGITPAEQEYFAAIMSNDLSTKVKGRFMGAKLGVYNKISNANVEYVDVKKVLNQGLSVMNIFGHSSQNSPDVEVGRASDPAQGFNNKGRYPLVIINGCFSGNIYDLNYSMNEDWIFEPDKGAVLFWAASDEGFTSLLRRHMNDFYSVAFQDSALFGKSFGEIQKETMRRFLRNFSSDPRLDSSFMQQFNVHGDPVIRIFGGIKPDYKTSNAEVFHAGRNLNAASTSLRLGVVVSNFGRYNGDSLDISITRRFSNGQTRLFAFTVKPVSYLDTFYLELPQNESFEYSGMNRIEVALDFLNASDEMNENNNRGILEIFVPSASILPLFPKKYSIVSSRNVRLTVQATDFFAPGRRYIFQVDTSAFFNSPLFAQSPPILAGNLCIWNFLLPIDRDSTVFFWRVRFADQTSISDTTWFHMNFEYIKNSSSGWAQSHFYQFKETEDQGIRKIFSQRAWEFPGVSTELNLEISGGSRQGPKYYFGSIDGISVLTGTIGSSDCFQPGIPRVCGMVLDRCNLKPRFWAFDNSPGSWFLTGCGKIPFSVNSFLDNPGYNSLPYVDQFIRDFAREGDYVILFPVDSLVNLNTFKQAAGPYLPYIGVASDFIDNLQPGNPFIIVGKKTKNPSPGEATLILAQNNGIPSNRQTLKLKKTITTGCASGTITSTKIGPSAGWNNLYNRFGNIFTDKDKVSLSIKGIRLNGSDSLLVKSVPSFPYSLSAIPADTFPYLQLEATIEDSANFTPAFLRRWMVTYETVPEGAINTSVFPQDEYKKADLQEGDSVKYRFAYTNISDKPFADSVKVRFNLNSAAPLWQNLGKISPGQTVQFDYPRISTLGKGGSNNLLCFVNPRLQPEEYYENNALNLNFNVKEDKIQPLLDVTFDGVKIMNGDFVSNTPLISVVLKDENRFLLKKDTSGMLLILNRPCQACVPERIPLNSPQVKVFPAGRDNYFRIEYRPEKLENGNYRLAVQGSDVKGNESGSQFYQVDFQVSDQKTITHFYPYPNPFSTSCQWVFTVTGELPGDFKIQIMTISGKVVREIEAAELGPLRIGNNLTSYRWNGTDEFGDRLANGVYLYRVVMKDPSTFANRETAADHTFTKGFGKLYIIR